MNSFGVLLKRKSVEKVEPVLPMQKKQREPSREGRTVYKQLRPPSEELKQFRKKQLYTNLSTQKSDTNIKSEEIYLMKHSRFNDNHHNTESIAQLFGSKMGSHLNTVRTNMPKESLEPSQGKLTSQKQSIESESAAVKDSNEDRQVENGSQNVDEGSKQGENYDDYVLGEKVEEESQASDQKMTKIKKYKHDHISKSLNGYTPTSESQLRMQQRYINNEKRKLLQLHEDQQILDIIQQYKNQKQAFINQSTRRHQTARILAAAQKPQQKIEKILSLPALKPIKEVIVPESLNEEEQPDKMSKNLLAKGIDPEPKVKPYVERILKKSLSYGKLGFGKKRVRTICEKDLYEEQMVSVDEIRTKLKSKGIKIDTTKLAKGIVNHKHLPNYGEAEAFPQPQLPSNPIYKKFPL